MKFKYMTLHGGNPKDFDNMEYWGHKVEGEYFVCVIEADSEDESIAEYELGFDHVIEVTNEDL